MDPTNLDMNLLVPLQALLETRNVTRAAERIYITQPAMSARLARLRRHFDDELLVRAGREYELTPLGRRLLPTVNQAIESVTEVFGAQIGFHALTSDRRFTLTASNYAAGVVGPPLRRYLRTFAPSVSVEFHSMPKVLAEGLLLSTDLLIAPTQFGIPGARRQLFSDTFVCLMDSAHPLASGRGELTAADLDGADYADVSFVSDLPTDAHGIFDDLGVARRVAVATDDWAALPWLIRDTDLLAAVPRRLGEWLARSTTLTVRELPGSDNHQFVEAAYWHVSRATDAGVVWLCDALAESLRDTRARGA